MTSELYNPEVQINYIYIHTHTLTDFRILQFNLKLNALWIVQSGSHDFDFWTIQSIKKKIYKFQWQSWICVFYMNCLF